jgi:glycylpeptide N-tetradecanoyltransferase
MPIDDVIVTYVTTDEETGEVDNLLSFYQLPSTVVDHPRYKSLKAAYSFYNVAEKSPLIDLMHDALVTAKNSDYDVFNALNLMDNEPFLEELKFGIGDGNLNYYLYNWKCPTIEPKKIGLVLQ